MRLNQSILFAATIVAAATGGTAFGQTSTENPPSTPPDTQVQPTPEGTPPPEAPPPYVEPAPLAAPAPTYPGQPVDVVPPPAQARWTPASYFGVGVMAGGGVTDFTNGTTRNVTNTGGSWTARVAIGTRSIVGVEGSYIGGANTISGLGFGNATLVRNGVEGVLRVNAPLHFNDTLLEPYILAGAGWNAYHVTNYNSAANASLTTGTDNTVSVPLGVGFSVGYRGFLADLRYTYRPTYDQSIFQNQTSGALSNWDFGGMLGYEF